MSDPVLQCHRISKRYRLGSEVIYRSIRETPTDSARQALRYLTFRGPGHSAQPRYVWALNDVSFNLQRGEALGIIGSNGAGKSTLLKILTRVTKPTRGYARVQGQIGSLLEVGTGFHPELTGRENIFFNGAILGMTSAEIRQRFDQIVDFAEVEAHLDTAVKRYSTGMYMRLAFAVAAHLEPDILIVDEVLAVGDTAFQRKCLRRMSEVVRQERTVLFVSHNMAAVENLCSRALWLKDGSVVSDGPAADVVSHYLKASVKLRQGQFWPDPASAPGNNRVRLRKVDVHRVTPASAENITTSSPVSIVVEFWNLNEGAQLSCVLQIFNETETLVFTTSSTQAGSAGQPHSYRSGLFREICTIPGDLLNDGMHRVHLLIVAGDHDILFQDEDALTFDVYDDQAAHGLWYSKWPGAVRPRVSWISEQLSMEQGDAILLRQESSR
jgi:lipopolysaccharide transport system ATP-binding protein